MAWGRHCEQFPPGTSNQCLHPEVPSGTVTELLPSGAGHTTFGVVVRTVTIRFPSPTGQCMVATSAYNNSYFCKVLTVRLLRGPGGWQFAVGIEAHGDMSLGRLQLATASKLWTRHPETGARSPCASSSSALTHNAARLIAGTLFYALAAGPPPPHELWFEFGESGYSCVRVATDAAGLEVVEGVPWHRAHKRAFCGSLPDPVRHTHI